MTADQPGAGDRFDVVVVGGGAAGALAAIRLLSGDGPAPKVAIVEPSMRLGEGAAYSTRYPFHLLNVPAGRMSAIAGQPDHFLDFLERRHGGPRERIAGSFVARGEYARYLQATLDAMPARDALAHVHARATGIERDGDGWRLQLSSSQSLHARHVVLAIGNAPRPLPQFLLHQGVRVAEAWDYDAVAAIPADADVCILGTGLSMVDAALLLGRPGRRGRILALSRHGLAPLSHAPGHPPDPASPDPWLALGVRARLRLLRHLAAARAAKGEPWQWTLERLRPHGQALWRSLDPYQQRRFLRHAVRYWDIHRHRIAPEVASAIATMREEGRLELVAGRLRAVTAHPEGGSCIHFRPRGQQREHMRRADWIVNASGVETGIELRPGALLQAMRERGLVLAGRHGLGLACDGDGLVLDARARPQPGLHVIGALRLGELWETIAVPELREQARDIATAILADRAGVP